MSRWPDTNEQAPHASPVSTSTANQEEVSTIHESTLVITIAVSFGLALIMGFIAVKLKIPAIVGYLVAGVIIGPATPGLVADVGVATELAEIGVMLLMFGVGLHLSLDDLLAVKRIAIPGALVQMAVATALGMLLALQWGWSTTSAAVFGVSLSCASTVVLLKAMESRGLLESMNGRIAIGWLVVEDLVTVLALVILPPLAGQAGALDTPLENQSPTWVLIGLTSLQLAAFFAVMLFVGRKLLPWVLWQVARTGSRELFTLAVIAIAIGISVGAAELFNVSYALGAFVAGMVLRESEFSHRAAEDSLPLRDAFAVLFFVSVGMLLEPSIFVDQPMKVLAVVLIIMLGKSLAATILVLVLRYPINTALIMGASLAQIGEFSFVLAGLGLSLAILPVEGVSLVVAAAFISIALNPMMFFGMKVFKKFIMMRVTWARKFDFENDELAVLPDGIQEDELSGHVIVVGYGRVGKRIFEQFTKQGITVVVIDYSRERIEDLREHGHIALAGDGSQPAMLIKAGVARAAAVFVAAPDSTSVRNATEAVRALNPTVEIVMRTHSKEESQFMDAIALGRAFFGEQELADSMVSPVLNRLKEE